MKHPCIVQIRDFDKNSIELIKRMTKKMANTSIEEKGYNLDLFFSDVNDARFFISKLKKSFGGIRIKLSTKYAGLRGGKVRILFTYSVRKSEK